MKLGQRHGDGGEVAIIELVDDNAADEAEKRRKPAKEKEAGVTAGEKKEAKAAETLQS